VKAITGADTLRPDLISNWDKVRPPPPGDGSVPESTGDGSAPQGTGHDPPSTERTPRSVPPPDPAAADEIIRQPRPTTTTAPHPDADPRDGLDLNSNSVADIVSTFYETVTQQPREAFDLLSPQLQGTGFAEFQRAWADVKQASVEDIGQDGPHAALVSVRLEQRDGSVLRTRQRVLIIPGVAPRIAEVTLLSAARS
jgi:hypothetical protein